MTKPAGKRTLKNNESLSSTALIRSQELREAYHNLETKHHGSEWTVEEDALAFLTDAALVGRLTMAQQGRWPTETDGSDTLEHKLGECIWWLIVLSKRMGIDARSAFDKFLTSTEQQLEGSVSKTSPAKPRERSGKRK